jgi:hypothetical protein
MEYVAVKENQWGYIAANIDEASGDLIQFIVLDDN